MFAVRNNRVYRAELIKPTKNNTGFWCKLDENKKYYLVSNVKLFENFIEALGSIKKKK